MSHQQVPSPTTEPASSTTLWKFVFVLKWKINKWVTSPTTEPASSTTRWKVVFVFKRKWINESSVPEGGLPSQPPFGRSSLFNKKKLFKGSIVPQRRSGHRNHRLKGRLCLIRKWISESPGPTIWKVVFVWKEKLLKGLIVSQGGQQLQRPFGKSSVYQTKKFTILSVRWNN